jgi:hypothetical protein
LPQQALNDTSIYALFEQVGCEAVPQSMDGH